MALLEIIEWFDETGEELVHRIPESGSGETRYGSQLVVRENQAAVFFRDGKGMDVLGPGRHTLSTQNIPILTKWLSKTGLFEGGRSPFRIEVLFINMKVFTTMKWGTREPVAFRDSELGLVRLRAFGNFVIRVTQPLLFVNNLVGTMGRFTTSDIEGYLRDVIVARLNDLLGEQLDTIFNLPAVYDELGVAAKMRVIDDFQKYGLELVDFFVQSITPPEEVQKMIDERAGMGAVGDLNKFMQFQAAKSMRDAARGEGGGEGGGPAAAGMGMGVGAGLGMMMPGMMFQTMKGMTAEQTEKKIQETGVMDCPHCQSQIPADSRFCAKCGEQLVVVRKCPGCGHNVDAEAKFCSECGRNLAEKDKCPKCEAELVPGSKFCPNCGEKIGD
jgi:membrane protease subunit (stomatin/prohibitin family)